MEDGEASRKKGYYVSKDIDIIIITPRGSGGKLVVEEPYDRWLRSVKNTPFRNELRAGDSHTPVSSARFPDEWVEKIEAAYKAWKAGQTLPEDGLPIAQWGVAAPSQRDMLARLHIFTVEQLAEATEEALQNYGMGGRALRQRARDYLAATKNDASKLSGEMAELRRLNETLQNQVKALSSQLEKLNAANTASDRAVVRAQNDPATA